MKRLREIATDQNGHAAEEISIAHGQRRSARIHQGLIKATITRVHQRQEELENAERIQHSSAPDRLRWGKGGENFPDSMSSSKTQLDTSRSHCCGESAYRQVFHSLRESFERPISHALKRRC